MDANEFLSYNEMRDYLSRDEDGDVDFYLQMIDAFRQWQEHGDEAPFLNLASADFWARFEFNNFIEFRTFWQFDEE